MTDVPTTQQELVQDIYRREITSNKDYDNVEDDDFMQRCVAYLREKDFSGLIQYCEQIEDDRGFDLTELKYFAKEVIDDNNIKSEERDDQAKVVSNAARAALMERVNNIDGTKFTYYLDEDVETHGLKQMTEQIYEESSKSVFFIADQDEWSGRISVELTPNKKEFELLRVLENRDKRDTFSHFGEQRPNRGNIKDKHLEKFFVYKFLSDHVEYFLFSPEKLEPQRCNVRGTHYRVNDMTEVGESNKLPINQEVIFLHSLEPAVQPLTDEEMNEMKGSIGFEDFATRIFGEYRHPDWFEQLYVALLCIGEDYGFPTGLLWMAEPGTGKSKLLESTRIAFNEPNSVHTGSGSTIKALIPSFAEKPPQEGYLLQTQRVALVDEVFNLLDNAIKAQGNTRDAFRPLLDLMEHEKKTFGSGNGSITGLMTSTPIMAGNPSYGVRNLVDAEEKLDPAFLSRLLMYRQLPSHVEYVQDRKTDLKRKQAKGERLYPEFDDVFLSLMDTLRDEVRIEVDWERVDDVLDDLREVVPEEMIKTVFNPRFDMHVANVTAGLAKYRTITEERETFHATDEDYETAKEILETVISSWSESADLANMSPRSRVHTLTKRHRRVFEHICQQPGPVTKEELKDEFENDGITAFSKFLRMEIVKKDGDGIIPYFERTGAERKSGES